MPNNYCPIRGCHSHRQGEQFIKVPSCKNGAITEEWRKACKLDTVNPGTGICAKHFKSEDFFDAKNKKGIAIKRVKKDVIPSVNLPQDFAKRCPLGPQPSKRQKLTENSSLQVIKAEPIFEEEHGDGEDDLDHDYTGIVLANKLSNEQGRPMVFLARPIKNDPDREEGEASSEPEKPVILVANQVATQGKVALRNIEAQIRQRKKEIAKIKFETRKWKKQVDLIASQRNGSQRKNSTLERKLYKAKQDSRDHEKWAKVTKLADKLLQEKLNPFFSPAQVNFLLARNTKRMGDLTREDCRRAIILWLISPRSYRYLRFNKLLPLPAPQVLQKNCRKFDIPFQLSQLMAPEVRKKKKKKGKRVEEEYQPHGTSLIEMQQFNVGDGEIAEVSTYHAEPIATFEAEVNEDGTVDIKPQFPATLDSAYAQVQPATPAITYVAKQTGKTTFNIH